MSTELQDLLPEQVNTVIFGFEFDSEAAASIRNNDLAMLVLMNLQKFNVAIVSRHGFDCLGALFLEEIANYCDDYTDGNRVIFVTHAIQPIQFE